MSGYMGQDQVALGVDQMLRHLDTGGAPRGHETRHVDVKQVPDGPDATAERRVDPLARFLWPHLACMANTPGGGALVIGIADDGQHLGAHFDPEPVRARIFEISDRRVTPDVREIQLADGTPVHVWRVAQAVAPIAVAGRVRWRTHDRCVDVDPATWMEQVAAATHDWSREPTTVSTTDADPEAVQWARRLLRGATDEQRQALADLKSGALLRALPNATAGDGDVLSNAGRLLFTDIGNAIHYLHRPVLGESPDFDLRPSGPLLCQMREVFTAIEVRSVLREVPLGVSVQRYEHLPTRSAREAILNGVVHRDWTIADPTTVEQIDQQLRVTSPGGFPPNVQANRLLTGPSRPRYRGLAECTARLTLTERAGSGIDLMYMGAVRAGRPIPTVLEHPDPAVVATIVGGPPDEDWIRTCDELGVVGLSALLAVRRCVADGFITAERLASDLQDTADVARNILLQLEGTGVLPRVDGQPPDAVAAWQVGDGLRRGLPDDFARVTARPNRPQLFLDYVDATGRISTTEARSLIDVGPAATGAVLRSLWEAGDLEPSNAGGRGYGNYYRRPVGARRREEPAHD